MKTLNDNIKKGEYQKVYLIYGEEEYLKKQYKDRMKQAIIGDDTINYSYFEGDNTAKEAVDQWIDNILVQLITITVFYNPEVICIGGGISEEEWFINRIKDRYREECIRHTECDVITTKIDRCKYNNDANILGAIINASKKRTVIYN